MKNKINGINQDWYRLDNAAKIYPAMVSRRNSCVFRFAINLKEEVDPYVLQRALLDMRSRFPAMFVRVRHGVFWYYLEENRKMARVRPEDSRINKSIDYYSNNYFRFTVFYYEKRISLEVFHSLTDGTGAVVFLKALTYRYLELKGHHLESEGLVLTVDQDPSIEELEDSFFKYATMNPHKRYVVPTPFSIKDARFPSGQGRGVINGRLDSNALHALAKQYNATVTEYLSALLTQTVYQVYGERMIKNNRVNICIPINLRRLFPSESLRNFTLFFHTTVKDDKRGEFDEILTQVKKSFSEGLSKESIVENINVNMQAERNMAMRLTPLFLKKPAMTIAGTKYGGRLNTLTMSNIGIVQLPQSMAEHVQDFEFNLSNDINCAFGIGVITFNNILTISVLRETRDTLLPMQLFRNLVNLGLEVEVESNYWEEVA
ncbi:MAG: hypothetical protein WC931_00635 [Bacilli bacterium]|jgi:NRPS condensation-like uncharacterized protein